MNDIRQQTAIRALGKIKACQHDIRSLADAMDQVPRWRPGVGLKAQCERTIQLIEGLEKRLGRQLVVTLIGPCGSGKSTLLNALSGIDDLSETGVDRPTTRRVVVFCRQAADADFIRRTVGDGSVTVHSRPAAANLRHLMLVDTPDTDSVEQEKHIPVVERAIDVSDVLLCVFNAENPKTKDHVDFMAPYVQRFAGDSLVAVMNRCDRLDEGELKEKIVPEFGAYLDAAWEKTVHRIFCISARQNLTEPNWAPGAGPRHGFDQFERLRRMIFGAFNQGGAAVDRRVENSENLRNYIGIEAIGAVEAVRAELVRAQDAIADAEKTGLRDAAAALETDGLHPAVDTHTLLYQKLAARWVGPVGWLIAVWARLLILAGGIMTAVRFGGPLRRLKDTARALRHFKEPPPTGSPWIDDRQPDTAMRQYRLAIAQRWPDIAEMLTAGGFDGAVRDMEKALPQDDTLNDELTALWRSNLDRSVENASRKLGGWPLQLIFNLAPVGILVHAGWTTATAYFAGNYLPSNYFVHAGITFGIALFLSFFIFQSLARLMGGSDRITRQIVAAVNRRIETLRPLTQSDVARQLETVLRLIPAGSEPRQSAR